MGVLLADEEGFRGSGVGEAEYDRLTAGILSEVDRGWRCNAKMSVIGKKKM